MILGIDQLRITGFCLIGCGCAVYIYQQFEFHHLNDFFHLLSHSAFSGGFLSGSLHALTGPDHLAILLPLIINKHWYFSCMYGIVWGLGHAVTSVFIGLISFIMKSYIIDLSELFVKYRYVMDCVVGLTLVVIGLMGLFETGSENDENNDDKNTHEGESSDINNNADLETNSTTTQRKNKSSGSSHTLIAYIALFINGALLGVSWDGLPSLAPSILLDQFPPLILFLFAYLVGTVIMMGIAAGTVGEATCWLTRVASSQRGFDYKKEHINNNNTDHQRDDNNMSSITSHISTRLAHTSSLISCLIGTGWVLLAIIKYCSQHHDNSSSSPLLLLNNDGLLLFNQQQSPVENDGTMHQALLLSQFNAQTSVVAAAHERYSFSGHETDEHIDSNLDVLFTIGSLVLILIALFYTIIREFGLFNNYKSWSSSVWKRCLSVSNCYCHYTSLSSLLYCSSGGQRNPLGICSSCMHKDSTHRV